ncbi:MAG: MarR family winged helix-turn-helix transcriptional regulator [Microbacterium sp.]
MDEYIGMIQIPRGDGDETETAGRTLIQVAHVVVRLEDRALSREFGLSYRQMRILKHIAAGVTSGTELGRIFGVTAPAISETLESLFKKDLVTRSPHESDRRAILLGLTPKGEEMNARAQQSERRLAHELLEMLSPEEIEHLHELVGKMLIPNTERLLRQRTSNG